MTDNAEIEAQRNKSHPHQADLITPSALVRNGPGRLTGGGVLELHTKLAHRIFFGRRSGENGSKYPIIGLTRFHTNIRGIWQASSFDDPYADTVLIMLEESYYDVDTLIKDKQQEMEKLLSQDQGIQVSVYSADDPVRIDLNFSTPWGFNAARLLVSFDRLVRLALSAKNYGLLSHTEYHKLIEKAGRKIRGFFAISVKWQNTGIRRSDVFSNNKVAQRAHQIYQSKPNLIKNIPDDVMAGEQRPDNAPPIKTIDQIPVVSASSYMLEDGEDDSADVDV